MKKGRKKSKKASVDEKNKAVPRAHESADSATDREQNPSDFGGIPERDLKKNLGCG